MSPTELIEELKHLSTAERLAVMAAAMRLIRADLSKENGSAEDDSLLSVAGCISMERLTAQQIEEELYGDPPA